MAGPDDTLYVFALADRGLPRRFRLLGRALQSLSFGPIDVIVERGRDRGTFTSEALQEQHAIVAELAGRTRALLPARYGSVVSEPALRGIVSGRAPHIVDALARVRGRRQMTIRVFGSPDSSRLEEGDTTTGTAFLESRRARVQHVPAEVSAIRQALRPLVAGERIEAGEGALRVTIYHLVPAKRTEAYARTAAALDLAPHRLAVSGPWPAFAFAPELF
jgi:hypothetical protein